jgi:tetratricopeptide (TPR) repeat protein
MYCAAFSSIWFAYIAQSLISPDQIILTSLGYISAGLVFGVYLNSRSIDAPANNSKKKVSFNTLAAPSILLIIALIFYGQYLFYSAESRKVLLSEITEPSQILKTLDGWPNPSGLESLAVGLSQNSSNCVFVEGLTQRLLKLNDRSSQALFVNGGCSYSQGNYQMANTQVTSALNFDPLNTTYLMGLFQIQIKLNNINEAEKTLDLVKRINPSTNGIAKMEEELSTLK